MRPQRDEDWAAVVELHEACFRGLVETRFAWDPSIQQQRLLDAGDTGQSSVIVSEDGRVIGQLVLEPRARELFLARIMVHPDWQRRGIGRRIVESVIRDAGVRGVPVTLSVWDNNPARGLYEQLGFRVVGTRGFRVQMQRDA